MNMGEIIVIVIFVSVCLHVLRVVEYMPVLPEETISDLPLFFTPKDLWCNTKLNILGCLIVYLLLLVLVPLFTIGGMLYKSIKWVFTVGRKD